MPRAVGLPGLRYNEANSVPSWKMPAIVAVPGFADWFRIGPPKSAFGSDPSKACTCRLVMLRVSRCPAPFTVRVIVTSDEVTATVALVISPLAEKEAVVGAPAVWNWKPGGRVKIKVWFVPTPKSAGLFSAMMIAPSGVKAAPLVELADVSAEMPLPPVGSVTVTSASAVPEHNAARPNVRPMRLNTFPIDFSGAYPATLHFPDEGEASSKATVRSTKQIKRQPKMRGGRKRRYRTVQAG